MLLQAGLSNLAAKRFCNSISTVHKVHIHTYTLELQHLSELF
ncbi:hypothetical protein TERTU_2174 [Teredinibacter turnerae T7901]|uniref:Uncharacterized protein n=1 Tax=Teredinibacter turnerae (strain ATCC 39867 / T7901) TaxID=377629 RepID=C5BJG1_TERTT|nr:hypothetical protein TERTU_2174 [Teredinibacter turnerae T7901]